MKNKWSIIIRTQGKRNDSLIETLYSVAIQSYKQRQVILVLHSSDKKKYKEIQEIIKKFDKFLTIKLYTADPKKKRGNPLNVGLNNCDTKYVSFLDDDDILYPHAGEKLINELEKGKSNFVCGKAYVAYRELNGFYSKNITKDIFYGRAFNPVELVSTNFIPINDYIYDYETFKEYRFDERLDVLEDWDFLMQLIFSAKLNAKYIDVDICEYRLINEESQTFASATKVTLNNNRAIISSKYKNRIFPVKFEEVFTVYPDVNNLTDADLWQSEIGKLRFQLADAHAQIHGLRKRKLLRVLNKFLSLFGMQIFE
jgi:glycosyltransferase involved in cell wall biosynthesis